MENKIKYFIGCSVPVYTCNFRCMYCYLGQHPHPYEGGIKPFFSSNEDIASKLSVSNLGGKCYFNFCGSGETLMHPQIVDLVIRLINDGHYCDIITNGTLTKKFDELLERITEENKTHLIIKFSFHYLELKNKRLLDRFVENVNKIKNAGVSYSVEVTPHDELIPYIDEIKTFSFEKFGAWPQFTVARNEATKDIELLTNLTREEYYNTWSTFNSKMFDFKFSIFNKPRCEFCYAGKWSFQLNFETGDYYQCYNGDLLGNLKHHNHVRLRAIGKCREPHCFNGHAYMTFGNIPEYSSPCYFEMRDRETADGSHWMQQDTILFCSSKLCESNDSYSEAEKKAILFQNKLILPINYFRRLVGRIKRVPKKKNKGKLL